jgi:DNA-binding response OmpR family regulator
MTAAAAPGRAVVDNRPAASASFRGGAVRMKLLVIEDEERVASFIAKGLKAKGHVVLLARTGRDGLAMAAEPGLDAIVLDLGLPDIDGTEVLRRLRAHERVVPVVVLTARGEVGDRVRGLDLGADDYLVKPFAFPELLARVRALLRRDTGAAASAVWRVGSLRLDTGRHEVFRGERRLQLTPKEFAVLRYLMSRPGQVVSSEDLLEHVWDEHADPFTNTVRVTIGTLRRKLAVDGEEQLIETVVRQGYRLREDPDEHDPAEAEAGAGTRVRELTD